MSERVVIEWFAAKNISGDGFVPLIRVNGRTVGHTYLPPGFGYSADDAERIAQKEAEDEAAHYVGDWDAVVRRGSP